MNRYMESCQPNEQNCEQGTGLGSNILQTFVVVSFMQLTLPANLCVCVCVIFLSRFIFLIKRSNYLAVTLLFHLNKMLPITLLC